MTSTPENRESAPADPPQSSPVRPSPVRPSPVQPSPVQPSPVQPSPVQPSPVRGGGAEGGSLQGGAVGGGGVEGGSVRGGSLPGAPVKGGSAESGAGSRRSYLLSLAACLGGAALAAYAMTRIWSLRITPRTGMSDLRTPHTGADAEPWVLGLALVALAGTGALLATRGVARRVLGILLTLAGLGVAAGAIVARVGVDPGAAGAGATGWPVAAVAGGLIIALGGATAARLGHRWPTMSARYERKPVAPAQFRPASAPASAKDPALDPADHRAAWEALDRGDDPTR